MNSGEDCVCMHIFTCIYLCIYVFLCMHMCVIVHVYPRNKTCRFLTMQLVWIWMDLLKTHIFGFSTWCGVTNLPPSLDFIWFLFSHCLVWKIGTSQCVDNYIIVILCTDACYLKHEFWWFENFEDSDPGMSKICITEENEMPVLVQKKYLQAVVEFTSITVTIDTTSHQTHFMNSSVCACTLLESIIKSSIFHNQINNQSRERLSLQRTLDAFSPNRIPHRQRRSMEESHS